MYAVASDTAGIIQQAVTVTTNTGGAFTFTVDTLASLTAGHYHGSLMLKLCSDAACNLPQAVASISVPYDITVLAFGDAQRPMFESARNNSRQQCMLHCISQCPPPPVSIPGPCAGSHLA